MPMPMVMTNDHREKAWALMDAINAYHAAVRPPFTKKLSEEDEAKAVAEWLERLDQASDRVTELERPFRAANKRLAKRIAPEQPEEPPKEPTGPKDKEAAKPTDDGKAGGEGTESTGAAGAGHGDDGGKAGDASTTTGENGGDGSDDKSG